MTEKEHYEKAIQYVRDNHGWSEAEEQVAIDNIDHYRCDISTASDKIACEIADLMDDYGKDNDLADGWWWEFANVDDIFFKL